jgi:hypothetical protein
VNVGKPNQVFVSHYTINRLQDFTTITHQHAGNVMSATCSRFLWKKSPDLGPPSQNRFCVFKSAKSLLRFSGEPADYHPGSTATHPFQVHGMDVFFGKMQLATDMF